MLQQTQVSRVLTKYEEWLAVFSDLPSLAAASLSDVLAVWQGLGYNRRARALKRLAEIVVAERDGEFPRDQAALRTLPGVGPSTAGAVAAFAFGEPHPFIETNIRAAYLHHFFPDQTGVADRDLLPLVDATLDREDPRTWYYALMDYGVMLKGSLPNPSRRSRHHVHQSPFAGSNRQLRASVVRILLERPGATAPEIAQALAEGRLPGLGDPAAERVRQVLTDLAREGFVVKEGAGYRIG